jgi:hypothetical protein
VARRVDYVASMKKFSILLLAIAACSSSKAADSKAATTKLPKLGLSIDVPGEIRVADAIMGDGNMVQGERVGAMQIEAMKAPKSLDEEKTDAADFSPKNVKTETLPDGWVITYDNKGSMGTNYFVTVRRDIAGKSYKCWATGGDADQAKAVVAACKTLRG